MGNLQYPAQIWSKSTILAPKPKIQIYKHLALKMQFIRCFLVTILKVTKIHPTLKVCGVRSPPPRNIVGFNMP